MTDPGASAARNKQWIVVHDPTGEWWEGAIVDQQQSNQLESRGVALLPVVPDMFRRSGVGGYHKRSWGAGWALNTTVPRLAAPMTLYCSPDFSALYWKACIVLDEPTRARLLESEPPVLFTGFLRVAADYSQAIAHKMGLTPDGGVDARDLTPQKFKDGGFIIGGRAVIRVPQEAHYGIALFGMMPGARVAWAAVSQAAE